MIKPIYTIILDNKDITSNLSGRLISMQITENRGLEADILSIELDDSDGLLELPKRGVKLKVSLGWSNGPVLMQNIFTVDECEHTGTPDRLSLSGKSANLRETLNIKREESYDNATLEQIVKLIANRNQLKYKIDNELSKLIIDHIDQTKESDASFLTRAASEFDAIATLKNGMLLILKNGAGRTVKGEIIPTEKIVRSSGDSHRFFIADRDAYTGVKAYWLDYKSAEQKQTTRSKDNKDNNILVGADGNVKILRHTYATKKNAMRAAVNEWAKLQRGAAQFNIKLAQGRPDLFPEMPVEVSGFKNEIDSTLWTVTRCSHSIDGSGGFTTSIELEIKLETDEMNSMDLDNTDE